MAYVRLLLDTNVIIDFLNEREPFYQNTRTLMIAGRIGDIELYIASSQITDIIYVLSEGGKHSLIPEVLERLRGLRSFIRVASVSSHEIDQMLATSWKDPEDALLFETALSLKADAIITCNQKDYESTLIKVMDCKEFFQWFGEEHGIHYEEVAL